MCIEKEVDNVYKMFFKSIVKGNIDELEKTAHEILGFEIYTIDEIGNSISNNKACISRTQFENIYNTFRMNQDSKVSPILGFDKILGKRTCMSILRKKGKVIGYSVFVIDEAEINEHDIEIMKMFNDAATVILETKRTKIGRLNNESLKVFRELILNKENMTIKNKEKLEKFTYAYSGNYIILVSEFFGTDYNEEYYFNFSLELMKRKSVLSLVFENRLVTLCCDVDNASTNIDNMNFRLKELILYLKRKKLSTSISECFGNISEVASEFNKTLLTLKTAKKMKSNELIHRYEDFAPMQIYYAAVENYGCSSFANPILGKLREYDENNRTEYFETLEKFVLNNSDFKKAAEELFLHKNTIVYRINRIKDIFEIDCDNQKLMHKLFCDFYMLRISR